MVKERGSCHAISLYPLRSSLGIAPEELNSLLKAIFAIDGTVVGIMGEVRVAFLWTVHGPFYSPNFSHRPRGFVERSRPAHLACRSLPFLNPSNSLPIARVW